MKLETKIHNILSRISKWDRTKQIKLLSNHIKSDYRKNLVSKLTHEITLLIEKEQNKIKEHLCDNCKNCSCRLIYNNKKKKKIPDKEKTGESTMSYTKSDQEKEKRKISKIKKIENYFIGNTCIKVKRERNKSAANFHNNKGIINYHYFINKNSDKINDDPNQKRSSNNNNSSNNKTLHKPTFKKIKSNFDCKRIATNETYNKNADNTNIKIIKNKSGKNYQEENKVINNAKIQSNYFKNSSPINNTLLKNDNIIEDDIINDKAFYNNENEYSFFKEEENKEIENDNEIEINDYDDYDFEEGNKNNICDIIEDQPKPRINSNHQLDVQNKKTNNFNIDLKNINIQQNIQQYYNDNEHQDDNNKNIKTNVTTNNNANTNYLSDDLSSEDGNTSMMDIYLSDLVGLSLPTEKNPMLCLPKLELELLEIDSNEKTTKFFNSKLIVQKCNKKIASIQASGYLNKPSTIKEYGWVLIYDSRFYMKLFIVVKKNYYVISVNCKNKRFKNFEGFDYFPELTYREFFFLAIIKYIVYCNKKDSIGLFQYFLTSIDIFNNNNLVEFNFDELIINPAINLEMLQVINLKQCYLRQDAMEFICSGLSECRFVVELSLEENKLNDKAINYLSSALQSKDCSIVTLGLGYNSIGDNGAKVLANSLKNNFKLKTIGLYDNELGDIGVSAFGELFLSNNTIETINLSKNFFKYAGLKSLIKGLKFNTGLKVIGMEFCNIYDEGAYLIKELLIENSCLKGINLSNNYISDLGFISICEGLNINSQLTVLSLRRNNISDVGATFFSQTLKTSNKMLECAYLHENNIGNEGALNLFDALKTNQKIKNIYLYENSMSYDIKSIIRLEEYRIKV